MVDENKIDYYAVGTRDNIVISNSSLSAINPEQGGSPLQFLDFFDEHKEEKQSKSFRLGNLIHKWAENKDAFVVSEVCKPAEKLGDVADEIILRVKSGHEINDKLYLDAARFIGYQNNYKDDTLIKKVKEGTEAYVKEIVETEAKGLIYLTASDKETIQFATEAIEKHPVAKKLLFMTDTEFSNVIKLKEVEIYWTKTFTGNRNGEDYSIEQEFKAKLDDLVIDFDKKKIIYTDPKTTGSGAYSFHKSFSNFRYYRQFAFYDWAIRMLCKQKGWDITGFTKEFYSVSVETNKLLQCTVWTPDSKWLEKGKKEYQSLIERIIAHRLDNQWDYSIEETSNNYVMVIPYEEED